MSDDTNFDYKEYFNSLSDEEKKFIKRFYQDFYQGHHNREGSVITEEMKEEATRNLNYYKTELFYQKDKLNHLPEDYDLFMQDASDEWDWQNELNRNGYEAALEMIYEQAIRDLDNKYMDKKTVLMRYYEQRDRLRRMENKEKREKKEKKNE